MAEYGFQSFPDKETIEFYTGKEELNINLPAFHQKSYIGNEMIIRELDKNYGNYKSIDSFLIKSQLTQALAYKMAIEAHRINKIFCGGTLFWQLNDCWPGPSWSVIDYFGRKKLAYEVVKDRYKPVILVANSHATDFAIFVVNDLLEDMEAKLELALYRYDDELLWVTEKPIKFKSNAVTNVYRSDIRKLLDGIPKDEVYLKLTLIDGDKKLDIEKFYFAKPKDYKSDYDLIGFD